MKDVILFNLARIAKKVNNELTQRRRLWLPKRRQVRYRIASFWQVRFGLFRAKVEECILQDVASLKL